MTRVRMRTIMSGPERTAVPGQVVDVPEAEARNLIAGGFAEPVGDAPPGPARRGAESAVVPAPPETAESGGSTETPAPPGESAITDVNATEARQLIAEVATAAELDEIQAAETANPQHEGGRVSVLRAIEARREELQAAAEAEVPE